MGTNTLIEPLLNFFGALAWPLITLIICIIFKKEIKLLLIKIKSIKVGGYSIELYEKTKSAIIFQAKSKQITEKAKDESLLKLKNYDWELIHSYVFQWAHEHKARNPYDMGPQNWERCLYDLKLPGGIKHPLDYDDEGFLKYQ